MSDLIEVDRWSIRFMSAGRYQPPEMGEVILIGSIDDGAESTVVTASQIDRVEDRTLMAKDGKVYWLGEVEAGYREWLRTNRPDWDAECPLKGTFGPKDYESDDELVARLRKDLTAVHNVFRGREVDVDTQIVREAKDLMRRLAEVED